MLTYRTFEKLGISYEKKAFFNILVKVREKHQLNMLMKNVLS